MSDKLMIQCMHDLERFGIEVLTGEADGLSLRLLCDVSPAAVEMLETFWGIQFAPGNNSWNHSGMDGWKSVLIGRNSWTDLARFALVYRDGCKVVVYVDYKPEGGGWSSFYIQGFKTKEEFLEWKERADKIYEGNYYTTFASGNARGGTRNQHYMSGRVD